MDKIKVNNQVVKMRKHVKRAKLFAINRFTKQIKQLQNKKGNDSQAEKNKRKVKRMLEKVKILKKTMPDFVSKKALSKAQNWNTLLSQKNIPLEDQCLALLANDSEVQKEVDKFHAEECHLVEKIPSLLLEWEVKSKMPKSPDRKKKASDIKRQKLDKIAKRRKSNFKGATFPNNVAVDKSLKVPNQKKRMLSQDSNEEDEDTNERNPNENSELMEKNTSDNDQNSELSGDDDAEEFFAKTTESKKRFASKKRGINNNTSGKSVKVSDHMEMHSENSNVEDSDVNEEMQNENPEPMEDDFNDDDQFNSESSNNSGDNGSEEFFTGASKSKKRLVEKNTRNAESTKDSPSNVNSTNEEESGDSSKDNTKNSISPEKEANEGTATSSQPSMFKRLLALANRDSTKLKAKKKSNSRNTKAIKVLDLNELQDSEQIPIQSSPTHSDEPETPQVVAPKKDSFFLNGDEEVQSSDDDESNTNNYRHSQPKRKFPNFDRNARDGKFKRNSFGDKPRKSFDSFEEKDFNRNENRFQNKKGRDFNQSENRFQNKGKDFNRNENRFQNKGKDFKRNENRFQNKGKDFNRNENRFQNKGKDFNRNESRFQNKKEEHFNRKENRFEKNIKGDFQFKSTKKFDSKAKRNSHDDSFNQRRENKNSTMSNSFQSKTPTIEKGEKNVNLHPSWEAKNKLKEAAKSGFKGKRIVFD